MPINQLTPLVNGGQQVLRVFNFGAKQVADLVGSTVYEATQWLAGTEVPGEKYLAAFEQPPFEIHRSWWHQSPHTAAPPEQPQQAYQPPNYAEQGIATRLLLEQVDRIRRKRHAAEASFSNPNVLMRLEKAETDILKVLGSATGELSRADEDRLCKTDKWIGLRDAVVAALEPYPDARKAVIDAIALHERQS